MFYIGALGLVVVFVFDGQITLFESFALLGFYFGYAGFVIYAEIMHADHTPPIAGDDGRIPVYALGAPPSALDGTLINSNSSKTQ